MFIYKIQNKINGKIYIGKTIHNIEIRFGQHIKSSKNENNDSVLCRAIKKYGIQSFDISVVDVTNDKKVLNEKEKHWIKFYDSKANGYNMTYGGDGGNLIEHKKNFACSEETKQKIRNSLLGRKASEETKKKLKGRPAWNKGKKATEELRRKLSESHKGLPGNNKGKKFPYKPRKPRPDMVGENNPAKRPEVREKLSEKLKGKKGSYGNLGKRHPYKPRPKAKGRVVWNKGLTKETDERVKKISETEKNTKSKVRI